MALVLGPAFSLEAHGSLGPVCYQGCRTGTRVIRPRSGIYPNTVDQQQVKANFSFANYLWMRTFEAEKDLWRSAPDYQGRTGKDHYMRVALERMLTGAKTSQQTNRARGFPFSHDERSIVLNFDGPDDANWLNLGDPPLIFTPTTPNFISRPQPYYQALDIDEDLDHAVTALLPNTIPMTTFSLSFDIFYTLSSAVGYIFTLYATDGYVLRVVQSPSWYAQDVRCSLRTSTDTFFSEIDGIPQNVWSHVCFEVFGTTYRAFLNNHQMDTQQITGDIVTVDERVSIGQDIYSGQSARSPAHSPFDSLIFTPNYHPLIRQGFK